MRSELARTVIGDMLWLALVGFGAGCVVSLLLVAAGMLVVSGTMSG